MRIIENNNVFEDLQKEWQESSLKEIEKANNVVKKTWELLHNSNKISKYPFFKSKEVNEIISKVTTNVLDNRSDNPMGGNGASVLLTGIRGIGKTTVMKGLCKVFKFLEEKFIGVYFDFELSTPGALSAMLLHKATKKGINNLNANMTLKNIIKKLHGEKYQIAMFLDEIQHLYVPKDDNCYPQYIEILREILFIAKCEYKSFGVISGSSAKIRDLAYLKTDFAKNGGFPNLNNNVYREINLKPIRDPNELAQLLGSTDENEIKSCFSKTGGVGRSVDAYKKNPEGYIPSDDEFIGELSNNVFFAVVTKLNSLYKDEWNLGAIDQNHLNLIIKTISPNEDVYKIVARWQDSGFIFANSQFSYEILVPKQLEVFKCFLEKPSSEDISPALKAAVLGTINGWDGSGSAGHLIEKYLFQRLCQTDVLLDFLDLDDHPNEYKAISAASINSISLNTLYSLTQDKGIDGFFISEQTEKKNPGNQNKFLLHTFQIKTGSKCASITPGGENQEKPNDQTIRGIYSKAQKGISSLIELLANWQFSKITFTLITTKKVTAKAASLLKENFKIDEQIVETYHFDKKNTLDLFEESLNSLISFPE